ncbi:MAG: preprotein translocase subunit SecA [Eubacteriales bacterium]
MGLIKTIFGSYSDRQIKKLMPIVNKIEALADKYSAMSDADLKAITPALKGRLSAGEGLDDILPDAYAAIREACWRVYGKRPFHVQLIGGVLLHQGRIAEMKTGEGKTITVTMPAYLNALKGEGVHVVTVNDYLAKYHSELMGKVFNFMGMSCGLIVHEKENKERREAYACDITYGTNNELGFDYLRDNMVTYKAQMVQRGHNFAIVDEVDSILIDEARTPLIISGAGEKSTGLYEVADKFAKKLTAKRIKELDVKQENTEIEEQADYIVDEKAKTAILTANGIKKAEAHFNIENLSAPENSEINHHVNQAIKAIGVMQRDVDYVVKDGQVIIVDTFTGRLMQGRRFSDGLHQAIEAKEHVKIERENRTMATITFQNFFRLYKKLSGMTGTALTEEEEFRDIYGLDVVEVPTNKPMIRIDHNDAVYKNLNGKYAAIIQQIIECHKKGQPVLVGTVSIEKSELVSKLLSREGVEHNVLNAKQHEREAEIVAQAGKLGAVTISTNMAGRGTDIMLGGNPEFLALNEMRRMSYSEDMLVEATGQADTDNEEILAARKTFNELNEKHKKEIEPLARQVCDAGGLFVIGTERHESRRIDNQLRGRSGRQGDPGMSRFYLSFEDDLMRLFGAEKVLNMVETLKLPEDQPIDARLLSNSIEGAQKRLESSNFERRKNVLRFDDVMNQQRKLIYGQRREVLEGADLRDKIIGMIEQSVAAGVDTYCTGDDAEDYKLDALRAHFMGILTTEDDFKYTPQQLDDLSAEDIKEELLKRAMERYAEKEALFKENMREVERVILLRNVDRHWIDHIDAMEDLTDGIGLRGYAQRDPIVEYRMEGSNMFEEMIASIREDTFRHIMMVYPKNNDTQLKREQVAKPMTEGFAGGDGTVKKTPVKNKEKVGRNDPCPCGSGKKYKKCCGMNASEE